VELVVGKIVGESAKAKEEVIVLPVRFVVTVVLVKKSGILCTASELVQAD